jgi:hypothetical protein
MSNLPVKELKNALRLNDGKPKVVLFNPTDESKDKAFIDSLSDLTPQVKIDFQLYDLDKKDSLFYIYLDLKYFALEIAKELKNEQLKRFVDRQFKQGFEWAKAGSQIPISRFLRGFMEEFQKTSKKCPWIILANIDVETETNHATIGSIVFDVITSPFAENVIVSCDPNSWTDFEKGHDIFARIASRLRSSVKRLG